jgi:hypothetical protein
MSFFSVFNGMVSQLSMSKVKLYLIMLAGVVVMGFGVWVYNMYKENQKLRYQAELTVQNVKALNDSLQQVKGELVKSAVFVRNLNTEKKQLKAKYVALEASYSAYIDSIHAAGTSTAVTTDTSITVPFRGQKSIAWFNGFTIYNLKTHDSVWGIDIAFQPAEAGLSLYKEKDIWKWSINSLTPGVQVMGTGVVDESTYEQLQKYKPAQPMNRYMIGAALGLQGGPELGYRADSWNISAHYNVFNPSKVVVENLYLHVLWCPF